MTIPTNAQFWDKIAEDYAAKPVGNQEVYTRKLDITKARLQSKHRVLDVGCGTGSLALELAPLVAQVDAVDISAEMVRIANQKAVAQGIDNAKFNEAPLDRMPHFEDESFDMVCAYNIIHLVDDRASVLRELYRVLKPGGSFVASTGCLKETWVPLKPIIGLMRLLGKAPSVYSFGYQDLVREFEESGFTSIEQKDVGSHKMTVFTVAEKPAGLDS